MCLPSLPLPNRIDPSTIKDRLISSLNILILLGLFDLLLNVALAHASLPSTLGGHLGRHADPSIATQSTHLHRQEDQIDIFEREVRRLWIIEVDDRDEEGQQDHEDQVGTPSDAADQDGGDHDDEEVPQPMG